MVGGNYYTCFRDDNVETRKLLYKLESKGVVRLIRKRKKDMYSYHWNLTEKGKRTIETYNIKMGNPLIFLEKLLELS